MIHVHRRTAAPVVRVGRHRRRGRRSRRRHRRHRGRHGRCAGHRAVHAAATAAVTPPLVLHRVAGADGDQAAEPDRLKSRNRKMSVVVREPPNRVGVAARQIRGFYVFNYVFIIILLYDYLS